LWNYGDTNQVLQVYGKPAQVQDRKLQLEGPDIRFDRVENRAIVNGAGVLRVPVPRGMDGKPLPEPQLLDVFWKEKMDFDGLVAKFFANVRSQLNGSELKCEEMYVTFNRRVNFADDGGGNQPQTDIHSVTCRDGVDLKSYEYQDNRLVSVRKARGFEFSVNQSTGDITSQGPGTLELWRRAGKRDGAKPGAQVAGNRARQVNASDWEYTRIIFHGKMSGNIKDRRTKFRDVERVVYGSIANSTETIDEERLPPDGGWMQCRELELKQVPASKDVKEHVTLKAVGNVVLDGRSFHALAHQVTFDESKDQYILSGDGKRDATIWRETVLGGGLNPQSSSSQRMRFRPSKNELQSDWVSGGEGQR
ncbi:MAG: hypothetical protein HY290_25055, partial [Planctomycetia bacterium]|nr:hypothetical protein [Planctomycetia bacterium]